MQGSSSAQILVTSYQLVNKNVTVAIPALVCQKFGDQDRLSRRCQDFVDQYVCCQDFGDQDILEIKIVKMLVIKTLRSVLVTPSLALCRNSNLVALHTWTYIISAQGLT